MKKIFALLLTVLLLAALSVPACAADELTPLVVGASSTPHAEVLELVKDQLAEEGYDLQIVIYDDYILPNKALEDGDLDANYFQHTPYLNSFNESNGTHLVSVGKIHYEPFGIYGQGIDDLADLPDGATIIIPGDDSNGTRALLLLAQEGLITLPEDASVDNGVTVLDVVDDGGYKISAVNAETIAAQLKNSNDGTIGVINYNYALAGGFHIADALAIEDASGDAAQTYGNIVAVKEGNENNPGVLALVSALQNGAVDAFNAATGAEIVAIKPVYVYTGEPVTLTVGASSTPHAEVLELVKDQLAEQGITLDIVIYDDYILPNTALEDGDLDANYFQHTPYLNSFNESNGTHLVSVGKVHYEPFGIYGQGIDDLADLPDGATIIIPGDDSNGTRALLLLAQEGLITLPEDASVDNGITVLDVVDDGGYKISAVNAETIAAQLKNSNDGTIAVINYNYALAGGYHIADALAIEDASGDAAQTYGNIVAVKEGNEENPAILALVSALQNGAVDAFNAATGAEIVAVK